MNYFKIIFFFFILFLNWSKSLIIEKSNGFFDQNSNKWKLDINLSTNDNNLKGTLDNSDLILNNKNLNSFKLNYSNLNNNELKYLLLELDKSFKIDLKLNYFGNYENVYDEIKNELLYSSQCIPSDTKICCIQDTSKPSIWISHNFKSNFSKPYSFYEIDSSSINLKYNLSIKSIINNNNNNNNNNISLSINDRSKLNNLIELCNNNYLVIENLNNIIYNSNNNNNNNLENHLFFIPKIYIGDQFNKIGISKETFSSYSNNFCKYPYKPITTVGNSNNLFDQFESFRNNSINNLLNSCIFEQIQLNNNFKDDKLIINCQTLKNSINILSTLSIEFDSNIYPLLNITSDYLSISGGILPISLQYNKFISILYIDFLNYNKNNEINLNIKTIFCNNDNGINENDLINNKFTIDNEKSIIINGNIKKRLEFTIKSRNKKISTNGYCLFEIYENDQFKREFQVNFSTTIDQYQPNPKYQINNTNNNSNIELIMESTTSSNCLPPKIFGTKNNIDYCIEECTIDQQLNMVTLSCIPIDCSIKYSSTIPPRTYYNSNTGLCETTPACPNGYSYSDNSCTKITVTESPSLPSSSSYTCDIGNGCGSTSLSSSDQIITPNITSNATTSSFTLSSKTIMAIFIIVCISLIVILFFILKRCCSRSTNKKIKNKKIRDHYKITPRQKQYQKENQKKDIQEFDQYQYITTPPLHPRYPDYITNRYNNYNNISYNNYNNRYNNYNYQSKEIYNNNYSGRPMMVNRVMNSYHSKPNNMSQNRFPH